MGRSPNHGARACLSTGAVALFASCPCYAATLASDGSTADTQAKIDAAVSGDVVLLPPSGAFTWSLDVTLPSTKFVTLDLNGSTVTIEGAGTELTIESSDPGLGGVNRVTNGAVSRGSGHDPYSATFSIADTEGGAGLRVDHVAFTGADVLVDINGRGPGVMDNCTFTGLSWAQEFIHVVGWGAVSTTGWTTDAGSALAGSDRLFYIEDCEFTQDTSSSGVAWIQGYYGCRIGIRHNSFDWVSVDMHGTGGAIGARWWECYANEFDNDSPSGQPSWAFSMRAGSGVLYDNVMAAGSGHAVSIGLCEEDSGYPADYQIGRGLNQEIDPAYVWNNVAIDLAVDACDAPEQPGMVEIDRDVFTSARPGYVPYAYPHPLRGGSIGEGGASGATGGSSGTLGTGGTDATAAGGAGGVGRAGTGPDDTDSGCNCRLPAHSGGSKAPIPLGFALALVGVLARRRRRSDVDG